MSEAQKATISDVRNHTTRIFGELGAAGHLAVTKGGEVVGHLLSPAEFEARTRQSVVPPELAVPAPPDRVAAPAEETKAYMEYLRSVIRDYETHPEWRNQKPYSEVGRLRAELAQMEQQ